MRIGSFVVAILVALALPATAQNQLDGTPVRVRGTVAKLDGQTLVVKSRDGASVTVALTANFVVRAVVAKKLSDIKPGDFVASTSLKAPDGRLKAIELHILPEELRGRIDGQIPWDLVSDSLMTNATVVQILSAPEGRVMKVTYKGTEAEIIVPDGIPIVGYAAGDASLLTPGAAVFVFARKQADGGLVAAQVTAEKDGVKPPM
jgi:hypothetical protein